MIFSDIQTVGLSLHHHPLKGFVLNIFLVGDRQEKYTIE